MRRIEKIMTEWLFTNKDGEKITLDLPHTWNNIDGQDGGNDYYRGVFVYEKVVNAPVFDKEKEVVYLVFEGVNSSAKVIVNDNELASHDGGYSTFRVDVTEFLKEENKIVVEVDNSVSDKVYPQRADFTFYGGIYRDVYFLVVSKHHFDLDYFGGPGVKVTPKLDDKVALVEVEAYHKGENEKVVFKVLDHKNKVVASLRGDSGVITIEHPHLWDGLKDPYLYKLQSLLYHNEELCDEVILNFGVRSFYFDPNKGFFLNGRSYPLHGVSRHQDRKALGNAIDYNMMVEDMELIKEVGANTIRLAHYQHNQFFYDLCDKEGMIVWAEIPYISEHLPNGRENTISQMKELIIQNYHHASIVTWGVSNEITIVNKYKKDMLDNHHVLQKLCHDMDPTRPTTLACYAMCGPFNPVSKITDLVGWNLYLGWYVPGLFLNDLFMKFYHFVYPNRCLCYSEYGAEGMPNLHSVKPKRGDHTEDYQAVYHEYMLRCFDRHPFMWANYVWNMFDFAADARDQGGEPGMNHKGLVTFDRKIKKDSFYLYKAWWSEEEFIHIAGKRFEYRTGKTLKIKVYSTLKELTLYHNGKLIETKKGDKVFEFVINNEEKNEIVVEGKNLKDTCVIYKTNKPKKEYILKKGKSQNWV